jgi:hypothetical protein
MPLVLFCSLEITDCRGKGKMFSSQNVTFCAIFLKRKGNNLVIFLREQKNIFWSTIREGGNTCRPTWVVPVGLFLWRRHLLFFFKIISILYGGGGCKPVLLSGTGFCPFDNMKRRRQFVFSLLSVLWFYLSHIVQYRGRKADLTPKKRILAGPTPRRSHTCEINPNSRVHCNLLFYRVLKSQ